MCIRDRFMTAGATNHARRTRARIYEPHRVSWAELREGLLSSESFWEGSSNVLRELREARSPATPSSPNERSPWQQISLENPTYPDVPGRREPGTAVYEYVFLCFQAQPLFASFLYWNFLSDGLRSSLIFSSMISTYKAQLLLCIVVQDV